MTTVYQSGAFCADINCEHKDLRESGIKSQCEGCFAYRFHDYLCDQKFMIVKDPPMSMDKYQQLASRSMQPQCRSYQYLGLGLAGEVGELCDKLKRVIRGDGKLDDGLIDEGGDVLWYLSQLFALLKIPMSLAAKRNIEKLKDRMDRGVIAGKGDTR